MEWVLAGPTSRKAGAGEISITMSGSTRGRVYFLKETVDAWKLHDMKTVDVSVAKNDPKLLLLQFRKDNKGGFHLHYLDNKDRMYLSLRTVLANAGAETAHYHVKNDKGVVIIDLLRDKTSYAKERKRERIQ